jgi:hypothetical protein
MWPKFLYLSLVTISPAFQTNPTNHSKHFTVEWALVSMCLVCSGSLYRQYLMKLVCCLMFDEMSMSHKFGCIEDVGNHGRTSRIANHVLVFMLCGLHKKWKESVAYYLIHWSIKGEMLVNFCKLVPPCVTRVWTESRSWNIWVFLKRHLSSCFKIKKLQIYLILPISLNVPTTFSKKM